MSSPATIIEGAEYVYQSGIPAGCAGHVYRVVKVGVRNVPTGNLLVLVEALTGPDRGLWFTCSQQNFSLRYRAKD